MVNPFGDDLILFGLIVFFVGDLFKKSENYVFQFRVLTVLPKQMFEPCPQCRVGYDTEKRDPIKMYSVFLAEKNQPCFVKEDVGQIPPGKIVHKQAF